MTAARVVTARSLRDQADGLFGAGAFRVFGGVHLIVGHIDRLIPDRDVALLVVGEQIRSHLVAAAVAHAARAVDRQLHDDTSHASGRLVSVIIAPPPRSASSSSVAMWKSGITRSHSSTASWSSRRARCAPRQRCGPLAKPMW